MVANPNPAELIPRAKRPQPVIEPAKPEPVKVEETVEEPESAPEVPPKREMTPSEAFTYLHLKCCLYKGFSLVRIAYN